MAQARSVQRRGEMNAPTPDYEAVFRAAPSALLLLGADAPTFTIQAVSDAYLAATMTTREDLLGRPLFEVLPDNPADPSATGSRNLRASLERVLATSRPDVMPVQRYDILQRRSAVTAFEERHWAPENVPVLDGTMAPRFLLHCVVDVTAAVLAGRGASTVDAFLFAHEKRAAAFRQAERDLKVHVLVRGALGEAMADAVLPLKEALAWLQTQSPAGARSADLHACTDGMLLLTLQRLAAGRWVPDGRL